MVVGLAAINPALAGSPQISTTVFDRIVAELNAKPDVPPNLAGGPRRSTAAACGMERADLVFTIPRAEGRTAAGTSTFSTSERAMPVLLGPTAVMAAPTTMSVNVDGSPRAYHPADPFGECRAGSKGAVCALNYLCYAGVRVFDGARELRCGSRSAYKAGWATMWAELAAGRAVPLPQTWWGRDHTGRSEPRYGYTHPSRPMTVVFNRKVIPQGRDGRPCVRDVGGGPYAGYFVSATSLTGDERADEPEGSDAGRIVSDRTCSPLPFVDAERIPAVVIPKGGFAGAEVGDAAVGYMADAKEGGRLVYGIVGDEGPNDRFGEGSVAFNAALRGMDPVPRAGTWAGDGDVVRQTHLEVDGSRLAILILKGTASGAARDLSRETITRRTRAAFLSWGGGSEDKARNRMAACLAELRDGSIKQP